jgi:ribosomal protein L31
MAKQGIHKKQYKVKVIDIQGHEFYVMSSVEGDIKTETSYLSHPIYNPDKVQKKVIVGRSQVMADKMARIEAMKTA